MSKSLYRVRVEVTSVYDLDVEASNVAQAKQLVKAIGAEAVKASGECVGFWEIDKVFVVERTEHETLC